MKFNKFRRRWSFFSNCTRLEHKTSASNHNPILLPTLLICLAFLLLLQNHPTSSLATPNRLRSTSNAPTAILTTPLTLYTTSLPRSTTARNIPSRDRYPVIVVTPRAPVAISTAANPTFVSVSPDQTITATATEAYNTESTNQDGSVNHALIHESFSTGPTGYLNDQLSPNSRQLRLTKPQQTLSRPQTPEQQYKQIPLAKPKSYKFTLTAGKYWRFKIKADTLLTTSSHRNRELRLYENTSNTNSIINDDSWFNYNTQQQQLFAWPSLQTKSATYYFVLKLNGSDVESGNENGVNNLAIAASIVVEIIRPLNLDSRVKDVDQLLDYKFSLENIYRQSSYPQLLNQIVTLFEYLTTSRYSYDSSNETQATTVIPALIQQVVKNISQSSKPSYKLNEFLLIESILSAGGEYFSIAWTYEPSLINNTITPHTNECRLSSLLDSLSKLSQPALASPVPLGQAHTTSSALHREGNRLYPNPTIYYPVRVSSQYSHAIIHSLNDQAGVEPVLKLTLNNQCQRSKVFDEIVGLHVHAANESISEITLNSNGHDIVIASPSDAIPVKSNYTDTGNLTSAQHPQQHLYPAPDTVSAPKNSLASTYARTNSSANEVTPSTEISLSQNVTKTQTNPRFALEVAPSTSLTSTSSTRRTSPASVTPTEVPYLEVSLTSTTQSQSTHPSTPVSTPSLQQSTLATEDAKKSLLTPAQDSAPHESQQQQQQKQPHQQPRGEETNTAVPFTIGEQSSFVPTIFTTTISSIKQSDNVNTSSDVPSDNSDLLAQTSTIQADRRSLSSSITKSPPQAKSLANYFELAEFNTNSNHSVPIMSSDHTPTTAIPSTPPSLSSTTATITTAVTQVPNLSDSTTIIGTSIPFVFKNTDNVPLLTDTNSTSASIVANESSLNEDLIGILNDIMEYVVSVAVPIAVIVGAILLLSITIALCSLRAKRRKSQQFGSGDRFKNRYGSERKAFLKNSSRPVILESDQKSLSLGGTPQHHYIQKTSQMDKKKTEESSSKGKTYLKMTKLSHATKSDNSGSTTTSFWLGSGGAGQSETGTKGTC